MATKSRQVIILPTGPEYLEGVSRNLISSALQGASPNISRPALRFLAKRIVNQDAVLPTVEFILNGG